MSESFGTGMMDEHQPRNMDTGTPVDYQPTPEERKAVKMVERLFEKAKRARGLYDQNWLDYYHMFRGKQWKEHRPSYRHSEVINFVFRTIQSLVPIQVDARPRFEFLPQEPADLELAEILNQIAAADWDKNNWQEVLLEVVYDANFYGTGLSEVLCDKSTPGFAKIVYESTDPFYTFPDPNAQDVNKKAGYFIHAEPKDVNWIKKKFPEHKDHIKPDLMDMMKGSKTDFAPLKFRSPVDRKVYLDGTQTMDLVDKDKALLVTCYCTPEFCEDEYEEIEKTLKDPETGTEQPGYEQRAKYPNGRRLIVANGILLEDGPAPYDDGLIPYQRYANYLLPREFWGISEVEQLAGPQRMFNKVYCFALDVLTLMGNPIWVVDTTSGVDPENLMNRPGLVVEKNPDGEVRREEGVQLQPYVLQIADKLAEWIDGLAGSQDITRGAQPTGVTAASAINMLQESAHTRIRLKAKLLDGYLQHVGRAWLSRTLQYRTAPEVYRLTNSEGATQYFRMHVEEYDKADEAGQPTGERGRKLKYQPLQPGAGTLNPLEGKEFEVTGQFDVRVATGSSLPFNKAEKEDKLTKLFQLGVIDDEELLKGIEFPNFEAVILRKRQREAEAAAAQMQPADPAQVPA